MSFRTRIREDVKVVLNHDPTARSLVGMALVHPGLHAVWVHRQTHRMWARPGLRFLARVLSQLVRTATGIEIHPAATLGRRMLIDHGQEVVIGGTAEIGDDVVISEGVTLGGRSLQKAKRHPTIEDGVTIGAGAKILGAITIGARSTVDANTVVVKDAPADSFLTGIPATNRSTTT
ncbi:serine O-acetyltransferase EpsC [Arthrobacter sp. CAN_A214]|uniref:serine O-acetyltransferase EpsC n=1 Tax=Arthrobacter sp. CAN_A214 TaxID=2787720 RepID=UPI0018CB07F8